MAGQTIRPPLLTMVSRGTGTLTMPSDVLGFTSDFHA